MKETPTPLEKSLQFLIDDELRRNKKKAPKQSKNAVEIHNAAYQAPLAARRRTPLVETTNAIGKKLSKRKKPEVDGDFGEEDWTMARTSLRPKDLFRP